MLGLEGAATYASFYVDGEFLHYNVDRTAPRTVVQVRNASPSIAEIAKIGRVTGVATACWAPAIAP